MTGSVAPKATEVVVEPRPGTTPRSGGISLRGLSRRPIRSVST